MADVRAAIERLFATGRYADIQVDAQPYRDGVVVAFLTKNSWFIGGVSMTGDISSPPNVGPDGERHQPRSRAALSRKPARRAVADQQRLLENNGLFRSQHPTRLRLGDRPASISRSISASTSTAAAVPISPRRC